ncbi:MAG TPA: protein kinase, partial [Kofleriaceae bacterium]|nr:protein kinase [Kofleriaceae bacterium]
MANNESLGLDATVAETSDGAAKAPPGVDRPAIGLTMRATVLPRLVPGEGVPELTTSDAPRFEPVRLLGRGGIGEVTLVQDNDIHRSVALKRLRSDTVSTEGLFRFVHEIRTVGQLEHPNIAPIYDVGIDDHGQHYFVMRYVEGETLETVINKLAAG